MKEKIFSCFLLFIWIFIRSQLKTVSCDSKRRLHFTFRLSRVYERARETSGGVYLARYLIFLSHLISSSSWSSRRCEIFETIAVHLSRLFAKLFSLILHWNMIWITLWLAAVIHTQADIWADSDFWLAVRLDDDSTRSLGSRRHQVGWWKKMLLTSFVIQLCGFSLCFCLLLSLQGLF